MREQRPRQRVVWLRRHRVAVRRRRWPCLRFARWRSAASGTVRVPVQSPHKIHGDRIDSSRLKDSLLPCRSRRTPPSVTSSGLRSCSAGSVPAQPGALRRRVLRSIGLQPFAVDAFFDRVDVVGVYADRLRRSAPRPRFLRSHVRRAARAGFAVPGSESLGARSIEMPTSPSGRPSSSRTTTSRT